MEFEANDDLSNHLIYDPIKFCYPHKIQHRKSAVLSEVIEGLLSS